MTEKLQNLSDLDGSGRRIPKISKNRGAEPGGFDPFAVFDEWSSEADRRGYGSLAVPVNPDRKQENTGDDP